MNQQTIRDCEAIESLGITTERQIKCLILNFENSNALEFVTPELRLKLAAILLNPLVTDCMSEGGISGERGILDVKSAPDSFESELQVFILTR